MDRFTPDDASDVSVPYSNPAHEKTDRSADPDQTRPNTGRSLPPANPKGEEGEEEIAQARKG